ncbi:protein of unassigned function [Methylobacterium oryzae CBMB20]|uniref:Protein of unassigned function n=1 Tax=Methylobacterium oryzae CBMB20 TaxID=693986 RepID=A0A089NNU7_9HYPH|nr:protein of unassigned function [Methylobacterium oryzae CBMB20]
MLRLSSDLKFLEWRDGSRQSRQRTKCLRDEREIGRPEMKTVRSGSAFLAFNPSGEFGGVIVFGHIQPLQTCAVVRRAVTRRDSRFEMISEVEVSSSARERRNPPHRLAG